MLAPPPFIFLAALAFGLVLQALLPRALCVHGITARTVGGVLIVGGLALSIAVVLHFRRAETPVSPRRASRQLVVSGPYRFSRNPDYLGQALVVAGVALVVNAPWVLLAVLPALLLGPLRRRSQRGELS